MKTYRFCPTVLISGYSLSPLIKWVQSNKFKNVFIVDFTSKKSRIKAYYWKFNFLLKGLMVKYFKALSEEQIKKIQPLSKVCLVVIGDRNHVDWIKYHFQSVTLAFIQTQKGSFDSMSVLSYYDNQSFVNDHNIPSFVLSKNYNKTITHITKDLLFNIYKNITIGCHAYYASGDLYLQTQASGVLKETYELLRDISQKPKLSYKQRKIWLKKLLNVELMAFNVYNNIPITLCKIMNGFIQQAKNRDQLYELMAKGWTSEFKKFDECCNDPRWIINKVIKNIDRKDMFEVFKKFYDSRII